VRLRQVRLLAEERKEMKPYMIRFWHGMPRACSFLEKVEKICTKDSQNNYFWNGTLDEFFAKWNDKFMMLPAEDNEKEYIVGRIFITPHNSFGQR
jgi:hypothetical protein